VYVQFSRTIHYFIIFCKIVKTGGPLFGRNPTPRLNPRAPSILATISKQHCRTLQVERFFRQSRTLLRHFCRFGNNVAGFGNNVGRNFVLSTMSKQIEHVQFVSTLSKGRNFTIESFDIVAVRGNKVECCFDIVAGVDGASLSLSVTVITEAPTRLKTSQHSHCGVTAMYTGATVKSPPLINKADKHLTCGCRRALTAT